MTEQPDASETTSWTWNLRTNIESARLLVKFMFQNPYWQRAWVVQEVFLAQDLIFWLQSELVSRKAIRETMDQILYSTLTLQEELIMEGSHYLDFHFSNFKHDEKSPLIDLLDQYADKLCADPCDRVYSLLALCTKQSKVDVDYSVKLEELAYRVLKRHLNKLCLCVAAIVAQAPLANISSSTATHSRRGLVDGPWIEFKIPRNSVQFQSDESCDVDSIELESICDCFHRGLYWVPETSRGMIAVETDDEICTVQMALCLLPDIIPHRIVKCSVSDPQLDPRSTPSVRLGWRNSGLPPHLADTQAQKDLSKMEQSWLDIEGKLRFAKPQATEYMSEFDKLLKSYRRRFARMTDTMD